ncbi:hypothetical protein D3874_10930 [Oleomonas cavernae]|uniref:Peptidase C58 YopT-type domain-containing protein n=2 Tax=Oleomonas cavernae TaxID=2320859 RepID=A0A418WBT7_9PROT|nr:hypothetical protein D3874_10930 [Oleomonas cavernae]
MTMGDGCQASSSAIESVTAIMAAIDVWGHCRSGIGAPDGGTQRAGMYKKYPYSQDRLLKQSTTDKDLLEGICVALSDYWLYLMHKNPQQPPPERIAALKAKDLFKEAMDHQRKYSKDRAQFGPVVSRGIAGARLGLAYDPEKTTIMRMPHDLIPGNPIEQTPDQIIQQMMRDIAGIGSAISWSLRFANGQGGHAIAGATTLQSQSENMHMQVTHLFDPNIGELVGSPRDAKAMIEEIATFYTSDGLIIESVRRTGADF